MDNPERDRGTVLIVENRHVGQCGGPPEYHLKAGDENFVAYFSGSCGDQWLLVIDLEAKTGVLRGGDVGWDTEIVIADNEIDGNWFLNPLKEFSVVAALWFSATGERLGIKVPEWLAERN